MKKQKNYGLTFPKLSSDHYFLGASPLPQDIINLTGDWTSFAPQYEGQADKFETHGCTVFGTENAYEAEFKRKFGQNKNFSERFIYILANIVPPGTDPHITAEVIRKNGLIDQDRLPITNTLEEFNQPKPMSQEYLDLGKAFPYELGHDWVFANSPLKRTRTILLQDALTKGPVCISVSAWMQDENGLYIDGGLQNNHWVWLMKLEEKDGEFYPIILDSYDLILDGISTAAIKKLSPNHQIFMAKRYYVKKKDDITSEQRLGFLAQLKVLLSWLGLIQKQVDAIKTIPVEPSKPIDVPVVTVSPYDWSTPAKTRKSCRIVMDEFHLTRDVKDLLCAVIQGESGFNIKIVGKPNKDGTRDYGIVQLNDKYWIGEGKLFKDIDEVFAKPEKGVRFMVESYKTGHLNRWYAYTNGSYKKYL